MKKKILIITFIIISLLITLGLLTSYIDSARVRNSQEPKYVIKIVNKDGTRVTYWGLGYKIILYPSVSPQEPYKNNRGVKYGHWFMKYEPNNQNTYTISELENITISISNISPTGATVTIKDNTITPAIYGIWYGIQKEIDGKWYNLEPLIKNYAWITIGYTVDDNNEIIFEINWKDLYGKLPKGNYRILKEAHKKYIAAPFTIGEQNEKNN